MTTGRITIEELEEKRFYQLPISNYCSAACAYCYDIGAKNHRIRSQQERFISYEKMRSAPYDACLLPCNFIYLENQNEILQELHERNIPAIIQLNSFSLLQSDLENYLKRWEGRIIAINILCEGSKTEFTPEVMTATERVENFFLCYFTLVINKETDIFFLLEFLGRTRQNNTYFHFPYAQNHEKNKYYSCLEIYSLLGQVRTRYPNIQIRPPIGIDSFDPRIPSDRNLEPIFEPVFLKQYPHDEIKISIIIPTYNNFIYLSNTIKHLLRQTWSRKYFEIIIVDDGSSDNTEAKIGSVIQDESIHFKFIYFSRTKPRKMGDGQFRAGIARNLGIKHSKGEIIFFLDSDILLPENYLEDLWQKHKKWDVIQAKRIQLKQIASSEDTNYSDIVLGRDTYITDEGYWEQFQNKTENWMDVPDRWRFVCTYALSMSREVLNSVHWIRKNYTYYGYEDTELGYSLAKKGYSFYLNPLKVYHLDHRLDRSEFFKSHERKKLLLRESAKTFYHNTLDDSVYAHLSWLFRPHLEARVKIASLKKYMNKVKFPKIPTLSQVSISIRVPYAVRKIYYFSEYQYRKYFERAK